MAHFTIELGEAIEITGGTILFPNDPGNETGNTLVTGGSIDFKNWPIFDEDYRERLVGLIVDTYYNREIGHETVSKFQLAFRTHMNTVMPLFNKMYEADRIEFDPLNTIDIRTFGTASTAQVGEATAESETSTGTDSSSRAVFSELPQTQLAGNEDYASNATDSNSQTGVEGSGVETSNTSTNTDQENDSRTHGHQGAPALLIQEYRESLTNVDMLVIDSLEPLFMGVWQSGDTYTF